MKILPLNRLRILKELKKYFKVDNNSVITYAGNIYSNNPLSPDVLEHEKVHLRQQAEYGTKEYLKKYINDKKFRLKVEQEAYQVQLESIKDKGFREAVRKDCIDNLTSGLYGNISREQAEELLPPEKTLDVNKLI